MRGLEILRKNLSLILKQWEAIEESNCFSVEGQRQKIKLMGINKNLYWGLAHG